MSDPDLYPIVYALDAFPGETVTLPRGLLESGRELVEQCQRDPELARHRLQLERNLNFPDLARRANELIEIHREHKERGAMSPEGLSQLERRDGVPVYRDWIVIAICVRGLFRLTHDPAVTGEKLARAFELDEKARPALDRVDRELFRARFTRGSGTRFLSDEEWARKRGEPS